ncbi:hypothetical protein GALMADRAFT_710225 [Galerina marginata CBS 339.88]|uniref:HSF-type DNA-binding domain-containing protein n=1 Tax=Galerina marginata (strain CBS 339.88) TaxID=685588 RepID=A0A067TWN6_GALM3|nr:hypothetical protein GALMADRAFT_710225 [Galerina marginata CBS 339.88]
MSYNESDRMNASNNDTIELAGLSPQAEDVVMSMTVTDFARKLYTMLEDHSIESIVCWGPQRDCFIVKDINEFSKIILPRIFNHSNFASFVRQLNKYDFHKVKQTTYNQGEITSTFRHPDFHGDKPDNLQNIKRKAAFPKASSGTSSGSLPSDKAHSNSSSSLPYAPSGPNSHSNPLSSNSNSDQSYSRSNDLTSSSSGSQANIEAGAEQIKEENKSLKTRIRDLEESHDTMQSELKGMGRDIVQQNEQMQVLLNLLSSMSGE